MPADLTPRTKLDFIYQEILGEVSTLVERLEEVAHELHEVTRSRAVERAAEVLERAATASASRLRRELERGTEQARKDIGSFWGEARWALYAACAGISLAAALMGGLLVVVARSVGR